ncbi:MAG TPA: LysR substrate-binding domain-containing protein [Polyangiaceae bacterium]|jgi:LysR family hydrogen peroxide-inducible transcriptional activator|nr:LysR substrate-binding domain-containing protein [Polyangiaceae bacterium]
MTISAHDLSPRQLQYVVAVAETLGFHKAAERCHVSQPTLSAQVKQLEDVLGVQLFERDRRRVLLTAAGAVVVAHARRVLVEIDDMIAAAKQLIEPCSGTFRIGVIPTIAPYLLPDVVPAVRARYPKLQLVFREEKTDAVVADLREGRLDAGLLALEADIGDWASGHVADDPFVVAVPEGHRLARKKRVAASDLDDENVLLLDEGHCFRAQALSVCNRAGAKESELRATSLSTLAQMVSSGSGITLLPQIAVAVENRRGQLEVRPFASPAPHRTIALIWRPQSPFAETFRDLAEVFRSALRAAGKRSAA